MNHSMVKGVGLAFLLVSVASAYAGGANSAFGETTVGSVTYPNGGMNAVAELYLDLPSVAWSVAVDQAAQKAYYALNGTPGGIGRVDLPACTTDGIAYLQAGEGSVKTGVVDLNSQFGYFGTSSSPGVIVKMNLQTFSRVGVLTLPESLNNCRISFLDPAGDYAYFGLDTIPAVIVKINLSTFTVADTLTLESDEINPRCVVVDGASAYVATTANPGKIVKLNLPAFTRVGALTLDTNELSLDSAFVDSTRHLGYFCANTYQAPARVVKIDLSTFTRISALVLQPDETSVRSSAITSTRNEAYLALNQSPGRVVKLDLVSFTEVSVFDLPREYAGPCLLTAEDQYGYFTVNDAVGKLYIEKVQLAGFTVVAETTFGSGAYTIGSSVIEPDGSALYLGAYADPCQILKVNLTNFTREAQLDLGTSTDFPDAALMDPSGNYAYWGLFTSPARILKVDLTDFSLEQELELPAGVNLIQCGIIDPVGSFAYFGTATSPGKIVKINLAAMTHTGTVALNSGENNLTAAAIALDGTYAYFTSSTPAQLYKVDCSTLTISDTALLEPADGVPYCLAVTPDGGAALIGTTSGVIVSVELASMTRTGAVDLGTYMIGSLIIEPTGQYVYAGSTSATVDEVVKVHIGSLAVEGTLAYPLNTNDFQTAVMAPDGQTAYFGSGPLPCKVSKVQLNDQQWVVQGFRASLLENAWCDNVYFYTPQNSGAIRLAIYQQPEGGNLPALVWQSTSIPVAGIQTWQAVPIYSGIPDVLILNPGDYWLCWQTNSTSAVAGYVPGQPGDGITCPLPYGPYPDVISAGISSAERWSMYVAYTSVTATPTPSGGPTLTPTTTPTETPTYSPPPETPTVVVTATPIISPTVTCTAPKTPEPSPTPQLTATPIPPAWCYLYLNAANYRPGDWFYLGHYVRNDYAPCSRLLFVALDVYCEFWFYPTWVHYTAPDYRIDYQEVALASGDNVFEILNFTWPDTGADSLDGLKFWAVLTANDLQVVCDVAVVDFGYEPKPEPTATAAPPPTATSAPGVTNTPRPGASATPAPSPTPWLVWHGPQAKYFGLQPVGSCTLDENSYLGTVCNLGGSPLDVVLTFEGRHCEDFGFTPATCGQSRSEQLAAGECRQIAMYFCPHQGLDRFCDLRMCANTDQEEVVIVMDGRGI